MLAEMTEVMEYRIEEAPLCKVQNQAIGSLPVIRRFVNGKMTISELADFLKDKGDIPAVGVVDDTGRAVGVIVTSELFSTMGRQYGWVIMGKKRAEELVSDVPRFHYRDNIFNVAESLKDLLSGKALSYFILEESSGGFRGLFSSTDLLLSLAEMTQRDIEMAHRLQERIANRNITINDRMFELSGSTESAKGLGGDYYHARSYDTDKWIFSVCDVSGKGVSASLLTTTIWGMMSIYNFKKGVGPFLRSINKYIFDTFEVERFITGIFLDFDAKSGVVKICDMGHSYIFLIRDDKIMQLESRGNMPIGISPEYHDLKINKLQLKPGDYLFVPTDGLLEQGNDIKSVYDIKNISRIIRANKDKPLENISREICTDFEEFREGEHLYDDVTFLLIKYTPLSEV